VAIRPPLDEARVRALVDTWVNAQNAGDFDTYSRLYAPKFQGVQRTGGRVKTLDRTAWLAARQRMFAKKMNVEARLLRVADAGGTALVRFEQSWASGSFSDVGPKEMVLLQDAAGLLIAREELKASLPVGAAEPLTPVGPQAFAFVVRAGAEAVVVLNTAPAATWAGGPPTLLSADSPASAWRPVTQAALPAEMDAWRGRDLVLHGPQGTCQARIGELALLARVIPHFGSVQSWEGDPAQSLPATPKTEIAQQIWDLAEGAHVLVGKLTFDPKQPACASATWARSPRAPDPGLLRPLAAVPAALHAKTVDALRQLKGHQELQKAWLAEAPSPRPRWWDQSGEAQIQVVALAGTNGEPRYVAAQAVAGDGCGAFRGELAAIWQVQGTPEAPVLVLLTDERSQSEPALPVGAADLDGDGKVEFIGPDRLWRAMGPLHREVEKLNVPYLDCPC